MIFTLGFCIALAVLYWTDGVAALVFTQLLPAFVALALLAGSMSYALYSYVDGISKELSEHRESHDVRKYSTAIKALSALKREVLVNAGTIAALLILERLVYGVSLATNAPETQSYAWSAAFTLSLRVACFATSVLAAGIQFHGFLIANEYRAVIGGNRK